MTIAREEIFGPVMAVFTFDNEAAGIFPAMAIQMVSIGEESAFWMKCSRK